MKVNVILSVKEMNSQFFWWDTIKCILIFFSSGNVKDFLGEMFL